MDMRYLTIIVTLSLIVTACDDNPRCGAGVCTDLFASIVVTIKDQSGQKLWLDSSKTYRNDGLLLHSTKAPNPSYYSDTTNTIINDNATSDVTYEGTEVTYVGWLGGEEIVSTDFVIGHDCCHIKKVSGPEEIIVP